MIILPDGFKMIFKFISGSHLYGTSTPESDVDERGIFIPTEEYFYGFLNRVEQHQDKETDTVYYNMIKFLELALENNPNIIEFLFVPEDKWLLSTSDWETIIGGREYFLSKKARWTFSGYAHSQLKRIRLHREWLLNPPKKKPERKDFGLPNDRSLISKEQIGAFNELVAMYLRDIRDFHELREQLENMEETYSFKRMIDQTKTDDPVYFAAIKSIVPVTDNFLEVLQKEKGYLRAKKYWDNYQQWKKNRNPKRAILEKKYGYDTKHASHLIRLMEEGRELLMEGNITFPCFSAELQLDIKNGRYSFDELLQSVSDYDEKFEKWYDESPLQYSPNKVEVDRICVKLVKNHLLLPNHLQGE